MAIFPKPPREIETERLLLRARDVNQAREMFSLIQSSREHLRPFMPWEEQTLEINDSKDYLALATSWWEAGRNFDFSVYDKATHQMVGSFGLHTIDWETRTCHVGFWMGAAFTGKGYVSEALRKGEELARQLGFHRLVLTCDARNHKSAAVAHRNDYRLEARQLDETVDRGRTRDTLCFVKLLNPEAEGVDNTNLPEGFAIQAVESTEFWLRVQKTMEVIFDSDDLIVRPQDMQTTSETEALKKLNTDYRRFYTQHFLMLKDGDLAGWTWGYQDNRDSFYMVNSAILPEHRGRGLYSRLLQRSLAQLKPLGFQKIWSRHNMTNNAVIVAKLKAGFYITGTELSDVFGTLVHLSYFPNSTRRKMLDFRAGHLRPDEELKKLLKLEP